MWWSAAERRARGGQPLSQAPDIAPGRLPAEALRAQLRRPAPAAEPARGARRRRALPVLLRRALRPGLPDLDRHPAVHPPDRHRQSARAPPRRSSMPTSWAACAPGSARPRPCARRSASARSPRASRSRSAACSATPPTRCSRRGRQLYRQGAATGRKVAVVGAGPAGLACAHKLATPGPRRHPVRGARQAGRPQRIRHRRLQDGGRLRAGRGRLHPGRRRHRAAHGRPARPRRHPGRPAPRLRRGVPGPGPGCRERAGHRRGRARRRDGRGGLHRRPAPGGGSRRRCRSAAASSSSAAA